MGQSAKVNFTADGVRLQSLNEAGLDSPMAGELKEWVLGMTEGLDPNGQDNEDGPSFWEWIESHHREQPSNHLLDTYAMVERVTGRIVGTASIVADDRGVGQKYSIEGPWLGGLNIRREHRLRDLATVLMNTLVDVFQRNADSTGKPLQINLFTHEPLAEKLVERWSFENCGPILVQETGSTELYCRRTFHPSEHLSTTSEAGM